MKVKICALIVYIIVNADISLAAEQYVWPVDAKPALTSTFCEFRPGHFHSGIDLKVYGSVGLPCRAIDDGYIIRLKVSPVGYGKALYLKLNDGKTAVYAHLERFTHDTEEKIKKLQHQNQSYALDHFLEDADTTWFKKGEIVAYSGRSGVKHPHVHFEIRDHFERPLNPLTYGFKAADRFPPIPRKLAVIPLDGASTVERDCQTRIYTRLVKNHDGVYRKGDAIGVKGRVGIGIEAFDRADAAENLLAIYKAELYVDGEKSWETKFDRFSFSETRQIERERDYQLKRRGEGDFHLLYRDTGNSLKMGVGDGVINFDDNESKVIDIKIVLYDVMGNHSTTQVRFVSDRKEDINRNIGGNPLFDYHPAHSDTEPLEVATMRNFLRLSGPPGIKSFRINNRWNFETTANLVTGSVSAAWTPPPDFDGKFHLMGLDADEKVIFTREMHNVPAHPFKHNEIISSDGNCIVEIPVHALYDTSWITIVPEPSYEVSGWIESVYLIEPLDQPVAKRVSVKILAEDKPKQDGWGLYYFDRRKGWVFLNDSLHNGYYVAEALSWERFGLMRDNDNPNIRVISPGKSHDLSDPHPEIIAIVTDSTSGVVADGLVMMVDGEFVPAGYDPPMDRFSYTCWQPLSPGKHDVEIIARDRVSNAVRKKFQINVLP